ncbi:hypothetical protein [Nocardia brasiliensis]|uniref:hypothetical protein n=1 Tax=Nocardia brasiliensis TaxID=37326 RepID=UPI00366ABB87
MIRVMFWNMQDLFWSDTAEEQARREMVYELICDHHPDVFAGTEIRAPRSDDEREVVSARWRELTDATGLRCDVGDGEVAIALGGHTFHAGLAWRDGITAVPGCWEGWGERDFFHSCGRIELDLGGPVVTYAVYHAPPFGKNRRADEAERLAALMTRPVDRSAGIILADWNSVSADVVHRPGGIGHGWMGDPEEVSEEWEYYDRTPTNASSGIPIFSTSADGSTSKGFGCGGGPTGLRVSTYSRAACSMPQRCWVQRGRLRSGTVMPAKATLTDSAASTRPR